MVGGSDSRALLLDNEENRTSNEETVEGKSKSTMVAVNKTR
ncbi:hypothetical protein OROGR_017489 [Orobanche gracilis]